ncbi:hypothetical protein F5883DRAFT_642820 [Diaporthe sp. PMI_573]|nr:hypothetical protein F5883DRAFT_642820 [Diaporthaceae sp. PMI_573]
MGLEIQLYGPEHKERPQRWCLETPKEGVTNTEARELCKKMLIFYEAVSFLIRERMYAIFNLVASMDMLGETVEAIAAENKEMRNRWMALKTQKIAVEDARNVSANMARYADEDRDLEVDASDEKEEKSHETTRKPRQQLRPPTKPASRTSRPSCPAPCPDTGTVHPCGPTYIHSHRYMTIQDSRP